MEGDDRRKDQGTRWIIYGSGLRPMIEEHAKLMRAYHVQDPPLPLAEAPTISPAFAGGGTRQDSLVPPTPVVACTRFALPRLSLHRAGRVIRRPRYARCSESRHPVDIPRHARRSHDSRTPSVSLHGHPHIYEHISYLVYSHAWVALYLHLALICTSYDTTPPLVYII